MGYNEEQLGAIADAIRTVTGQTDKIKATEFANIIKDFSVPSLKIPVITRKGNSIIIDATINGQFATNYDLYVNSE